MPLVFALMSHKTTDLYEQALAQLRGCNPSYVHIDFEKAELAALKRQFPGAIVSLIFTFILDILCV